MKRLVSRIAIMTLMLSGGLSAATNTLHWKGASYTTSYGFNTQDANNWVEGIVPTGTLANSNIFIFGNASDGLDGGQTQDNTIVRMNSRGTSNPFVFVEGITFTANASAYTIQNVVIGVMTDNAVISNLNSNVQTFGGSSATQLRGNLIYDVQAGGVTVTNNLTDATGFVGGIVKNGAGVLTLNGTNLYTGNITLNEGTLAIRHVLATTMTANKIFLNGGRLASNDINARTYTNDVFIGGDVAFGDTAASGRTGNLSFSTGKVVLLGNHGITATQRVLFGAGISDEGMGYGITKSGAAEMLIGGGGENVFLGTTRVAEGDLIVFGTAVTVGDTTVANGATLRGNGTVSRDGKVTVETGGILAPGHVAGSTGVAAHGAMKLGALQLDSGAILQMQIGDGMMDSIEATGLIAFGGALQLEISTILSVGQSYQLFAANSFSGDFESITLSGGIYNTATNEGNNIWSISDGANIFHLDLTSGILAAIPEPSTYALIIGAAVLLIAGARRRFNR